MKSFRAIIEISVGSVFYSWIFGFGGKVVIKSPEDVKDEYSRFPFMPWLAGHHRRVLPPPESVDGNGLHRDRSVRAGVPASGLSRPCAYGVI